MYRKGLYLLKLCPNLVRKIPHASDIPWIPVIFYIKRHLLSRSLFFLNATKLGGLSFLNKFPTINVQAYRNATFSSPQAIHRYNTVINEKSNKMSSNNMHSGPWTTVRVLSFSFEGKYWIDAKIAKCLLVTSLFRRENTEAFQVSIYYHKRDLGPTFNSLWSIQIKKTITKKHWWINILLEGRVRCALFNKRYNNTKDILHLKLKSYTLQS